MNGSHTTAQAVLVLLLATSPASSSPSTSLPTEAGGRLWLEASDTRVKVAMPSLAPLVRGVESAVVSVFVESRVGARVDLDAPFFDLFRRFGWRLEVPDVINRGQGTGFIIHPDGYALTNEHLIEGAAKIQVRLSGTSEMVSATVVGADAATDVALIKLAGDRHDWPAVALGNSDGLQVGDFVVAIGNPFGLSQSVSLGIVSAKGRRDVAPSGRSGLHDFIQTDASINPGNSGGPLLDMNGAVVGINAALNAQAQGISFAIPINMVKREIPELLRTGRVERAWIGVSIRNVAPAIAKALGLDRARGALVVQLVDGGPGARAGLKTGDVITTFDGKAIDDSSDLPLLAASAGVGRRVTLGLMRDGLRKDVQLTLTAMPRAVEREPILSPSSAPPVSNVLGLELETLNDIHRQKLGVPATQPGAVVVGVRPDSPAAESGLEPGDIIITFNDVAIIDAPSCARAIEATPHAALVKLLVIRERETLFFALLKP